MTFILLKCHRSVDNSFDFYLFLMLWKGSRWQIIQLSKCKILLWITNHNLFSRTLTFPTHCIVEVTFHGTIFINLHKWVERMNFHQNKEDWRLCPKNVLFHFNSSSFLRKSNFRILDIQVSCHEICKNKTKNTFY